MDEHLAEGLDYTLSEWQIIGKLGSSAEASVERKTTKVGRRGSIVIPASLRRRVGLTEGSLVIAEEREGGILLRPAVALPLETYSPERRAEFLLSNAVDRRDYAYAVREVKKLGLDPAQVPHRKPRG